MSNKVNVLDSAGLVMNAYDTMGVSREYGEWLAQDNANVFGEAFTVLDLETGESTVYTPVVSCQEPQS